MPDSTSAPPVTLKDIAQAAGVHFSTVSLALNGSAKVAAPTRDRVLAIAERLGYRRDPVYYALSARRTLKHAPEPPLIIFLTNRPTMAEFANTPHMPAFLEGAKAQCQSMGFGCELYLVGDERVSTTEIEQYLQARGAQGVIFVAFMPQLRQVQLDWSRYALVKIDSRFMAPDVTRIGHDQQQIVRLACQRLHAIGYRRIGLAVGQVDVDSADDLFRSGYWLERQLLGLPAVRPLVFSFADTGASSISHLGAWVRDEKLDVVISNWNLVGCLAQAGLRVPEDVAWANLCLHEPDPACAGAVVHHVTVGRKAVEMIALLIKTREFGVPRSPSCLYVEAEWFDGASAPARVLAEY